MAVINLEDLTGSTEVVLFPDLFTKVSPLLKSDEPLFVGGSVETGESSAKIIAKEICTLDSMRQKTVKAIEVNLNEYTVSKDLLRDLQDIVFRYPGECSLRFKVNRHDGKGMVLSAHNRFSVLPCPELIEKIEALTGNRVTQLSR